MIFSEISGSSLNFSIKRAESWEFFKVKCNTSDRAFILSAYLYTSSKIEIIDPPLYGMTWFKALGAFTINKISLLSRRVCCGATMSNPLSSWLSLYLSICGKLYRRSYQRFFL